MQRKRKVSAARFIALGSDGKEYTLHEIKIQKNVTDTSGKPEWLTVGSEIEAADGRIVGYKGRGHYELFTRLGAVTLKSDDPNAP